MPSKIDEFYETLNKFEAGEITEEEASKRLEIFRKAEWKQFEETHGKQ